jgi:hypothetical protein
MMHTVDVILPVAGLIDRSIWLSNAFASRPRLPIQAKEHHRPPSELTKTPDTNGLNRYSITIPSPGNYRDILRVQK